jgi:hypothetical protein
MGYRMKPKNAYTEIGPGMVCIGHAGFERSWSALLGNTIGLSQQDGVEWIAGPGPEFRIETDGEVLGPMDLGDIEWTEEYPPYGVVLTARYAGHGWLFQARTTALHRCPGLHRACTITNMTLDPATLQRVVSESLILPAELSTSWSFGPGVVCSQRGCGLLLAATEGDPDLAPGVPGYCGLAAPGAHTLEPGETWHLPDTFLLPFVGAPTTARTVYERFVREVNEMKKLQAQFAAEERAAWHTTEKE